VRNALPKRCHFGPISAIYRIADFCRSLIDPIWDPIRNDRRFQELAAEKKLKQHSQSVVTLHRIAAFCLTRVTLTTL
jgi:hypothetical protein